ncbi:type II secretion system F family protein [Sulfobacillus thermosulfidooxidans]|uniref:type II secretion system F family protein n=1 Tax=Sulfobacillus thermosulfidooxidans TaxID=28034 RepID=UPI0002E4416C|nr:hypothetical protein [Sulfobacillus thermosulfidooxidans]
MHSTILLSAGLLGLSVTGFLSSYRPVLLSLGSLVSLILPSHIVAMSTLLMVWGLDTFWTSRLQRQRQELNEQETELFLRRLSRMLKARGSLAYALDDLGRADSRIQLYAEPERVLDELSLQWSTDAIRVVASSAKWADRYGGSLENIIEHVIKHMALSRRWRFQRRLEEMTLESTVFILTLAPYVVLLLLKMAIPTFYGVFIGTGLGHVMLILSGIISFLVLQIFSWHIRNEVRP